MPTTRSLIALTVLAAMLATTAGAQLLPGPTKARKQKGEFVNAYDDCASPTHTTNLPIPVAACVASPADPSCALDGTKGQGNYELKVVKSGVKVKAIAKNLASACVGETLTLALDFALTTSDCAAGDCTSGVADHPLGACVVQACGGSFGCCKIAGALATWEEFAAGDVFKVGETYSLEVLEVSLMRGGLKVLRGGLLLR